MHTRGQISTQPTKKASSLEVSFGMQREMFKSFVGPGPGLSVPAIYAALAIVNLICGQNGSYVSQQFMYGNMV